MALLMFPIPRRDTARIDHYRAVRSSSYRSICRLLVLSLGLQAITLALLLTGAGR